MSERRISAIVLAGGRSSRFGRDKLAEPVHGKPLLSHAIESVRPWATEVLVVVAPAAAPTLPPDVREIRDPVAFEGPLAGLLAGLQAAREGTVLVTAGDMPDLEPAIVAALLEALTAPEAEAAVLEEAGRARPLPMALLRDPARDAAQRLIEGGERRLRALLEVVATTVIPETAWRGLDPNGRSLRDIDTPADLR
jgi:molybdopterin-guanine dinucleotide biosynthesis protein A